MGPGREFWMKSGLLSGLLAGSLGSAAAMEVSPAQAARLLERPGVVALDVRTPEEFKAGHIRGAINVDYRTADFVGRISRLNPDVRYVLYCRSGRRSAGALGVLKDTGVDRVDHMAAGILGWRSADLPLVTE